MKISDMVSKDGLRIIGAETEDFSGVLVIEQTDNPILSGLRIANYNGYKNMEADAVGNTLVKSKQYVLGFHKTDYQFGSGMIAVGAKGYSTDNLHGVSELLNYAESKGIRIFVEPDLNVHPHDMKVLSTYTDTVELRKDLEFGAATAASTLFVLDATLDAQGRSLDDLNVFIEGAGKVGGRLTVMAALRPVNSVFIKDLHEELLVAADSIDKVIPIRDVSIGFDNADIFMPCASGNSVTKTRLDLLRRDTIICGPALCQVYNPSVYDYASSRGIFMVPDYLPGVGGTTLAGAVMAGEDPNDPVLLGQMSFIYETIGTIYKEFETSGTNPIDTGDAIVRSIQGS